MRSNQSNIKVFVKSKRVPITTSDTTPQVLPIGSSLLLTSSKRSIVIYENVLDDYQEMVLESVKRFARNSGIQVEIKDVAKENILKQLLRRVKGQKIDRIAVIVPESALMALWRNST